MKRTPMKHRLSSGAFLVAFLYGIFNLYMALLFGFVSSTYFALLRAFPPVTPRAKASLLEMDATMSMGLAFSPTAFSIGLLLLLSAWLIARGWGPARHLARGVFVLSVIGHFGCAAYGYSLRPSLWPTPVMTMYPGFLGAAIQIAMLIGGVVFWVCFVVFAWRSLGPERAPQS